MREFYVRDESDANYNPDVLEVSNDIEALIYQVKMIMGTNRGEILGEVNCGANMMDLLFSFDFDPSTFNTALVEQTNIYSEMARHYNMRYMVRRVRQQSHSDMGVIDVSINGKSMFGFIY